MILNFNKRQETTDKYFNHIYLENIIENQQTDIRVIQYLGLVTYLPLKISENEITFHKWDKPYKATIIAQTNISDNDKECYRTHIKLYAVDCSSFIISKMDFIDLDVNSTSLSLDITDLSAYINRFTLCKDSFNPPINL